MTYQFTSAFIGIFIGLLIFFLIKNDRMHVRYAFFWFFISFSIIFLGIFPKFFDFIGLYLGINYPPVLLLVIAICITLIKLLKTDIEMSKQEQKIKEIIQRIAIIEDNKGENSDGK